MMPTMNEHKDVLGLIRTLLANERTFLSYIRTATILLVTGIGFLKFVRFPFVEIIGGFMIVVAILTAIYGVRKFFHNKKMLIETGHI